MSNIIDDIYSRAKVMYVSDLHDRRNYFWVLCAVKEIEESAYLENEWQKAYQYITGIEKEAGNSRDDLIRFLRTDIGKR